MRSEKFAAPAADGGEARHRADQGQFRVGGVDRAEERPPARRAGRGRVRVRAPDTFGDGAPAGGQRVRPHQARGVLAGVRRGPALHPDALRPQLPPQAGHRASGLEVVELHVPGAGLGRGPAADDRLRHEQEDDARDDDEEKLRHARLQGARGAGRALLVGVRHVELGRRRVPDAHAAHALQRPRLEGGDRGAHAPRRHPHSEAGGLGELVVGGQGLPRQAPRRRPVQAPDRRAGPRAPVDRGASRPRRRTHADHRRDARGRLVPTRAGVTFQASVLVGRLLVLDRRGARPGRRVAAAFGQRQRGQGQGERRAQGVRGGARPVAG
mmetsp:Transcript_55225/g.155011  ORF Transcript_55225/g.155011 Transcript_55225/m.155011 type:complete len:325 (+) Transcript_55225:245-1219(+)